MAFVNNKIGKKSVNTSHIDYINCNDVLISDNNDIADSFVSYFSNVGVNLASKIRPRPMEIENNVKSNGNSIFLKPTDRYEIERIILEMKDKAGGVDGISSKVLKCIACDISIPLEYILNKCINYAIWPSALKKADIIPVFKSGDKHLISNYRPISLISNLAKLFEKIIYSRLYEFCTCNSLISDKQYGFMKNRGTNDALIFTSNFIYNNIDKNIPTVLAFLDLAKAFDTVNHKILLDKLWRIGIRGIPHQLIVNYLSNRSQRVKVNNSISTTLPVKVGVLQGTILGPLLFILYINDIFNVLPKDALVSYADDTAIICSGKS